MVLITGAGGMLGGYLKEEFQSEGVATLGLKEDSDYVCNLRETTPDFGEKVFETVIHSAGTESDKGAMELNLEGTKRLIEALKDRLPENFVYVSSYQVYSREAGEGVNEETPTWATTEAGKSKALAEQYLTDWSKENGVNLTVIRPARMFGNGVSGETLQLFNDALSGKYIHIRGNDAKVSLVCALDVAKGIKRIHGFGGIYNVSDGRPVKYIEMVEALTANAGAKKRMTHLPGDWAEWLWRLGRWIPSINRNLSPQVVEARMKSVTLDNKKFVEYSGLECFDTIAVIERREKGYPYVEDKIKTKKGVHEV